MARTHDMGGRPSDQNIDATEHVLSDWEVLADAVNVALVTRRMYTVDAHRRAMEDMRPEEYLSLSYYERWVRGTETLLVEKGVLSTEEIDRKMAELESTWGVS
jgi:nitrile hydratase subunit beta